LRADAPASVRSAGCVAAALRDSVPA